jgi:hypothetical protein
MFESSLRARGFSWSLNFLSTGLRTHTGTVYRTAVFDKKNTLHHKKNLGLNPDPKTLVINTGYCSHEKKLTDLLPGRSGSSGSHCI